MWSETGSKYLTNWVWLHTTKYHSCVATSKLYNELSHVCKVVHALYYLVVMVKWVTSFTGLGTRV